MAAPAGHVTVVGVVADAPEPHTVVTGPAGERVTDGEARLREALRVAEFERLGLARPLGDCASAACASSCSCSSSRHARMAEQPRARGRSPAARAV
jgi:hypothetical protein